VSALTRILTLSVAYAIFHVISLVSYRDR
jgi:hypothetical protein